MIPPIQDRGGSNAPTCSSPISNMGRVVLNKMGCAEEIENMLEIRCKRQEFKRRFSVLKRGEEFLTLANYRLSISTAEELHLSRILASTIQSPILRGLQKMITYGLCQRTTGYDKVQKNELCLLITKIAKKMRVLTDEVLNSLSPLTYCRALDTTTPRELINSEGRLIPEAPGPRGLRGPRPSMQDLYDRMGSIEIRQGAIERVAYRQSYHWDRYHGVLEHMARVYDVPLRGAYNPPSYDQQQYQQYYQQYEQQQQGDDDE
ncbi:hypothetical protein Tco_0741614 [Tanacetum coccineum]